VEKTKKLVKEYKLDPAMKTGYRRVLEEDLEDLPTDLSELVSYINSLIDAGFTTFEAAVSGYDGYGTANLSYFKKREETDEEFQERLKVEQDREEKAERRKRTIAELTPEQREALGISQYAVIPSAK